MHGKKTDGQLNGHPVAGMHWGWV